MPKKPDLKRLFRSAGNSSADIARIAAAKELVTQLPKAVGKVSAALAERSLSSREFQFTLFCYLDDVCDRADAGDLVPIVVSLVSKYIENVCDDRAHATWMAVDLLTDHLPADRAINPYLGLLTRSRNSNVRALLVDAADKIFSRVARTDRSRILAQIRFVAVNDRAKSVRLTAKEAIRRLFSANHSRND